MVFSSWIFYNTKTERFYYKLGCNIIQGGFIDYLKEKIEPERHLILVISVLFLFGLLFISVFGSPFPTDSYSTTFQDNIEDESRIAKNYVKGYGEPLNKVYTYKIGGEK